MRSSSALCAPELAKRIGEKLGKEDWRGGGGEGGGVLIKSSNPHLTGGERLGPGKIYRLSTHGRRNMFTIDGNWKTIIFDHILPFISIYSNRLPKTTDRSTI